MSETEENCTIVVNLDRQLFYAEDNSFGIFAVTINENHKETDPDHSIKANDYNNVIIKGQSPQLEFGSDYKAKLKSTPAKDKQGRESYQLVTIYEIRRTTPEAQKRFLSAILTEKQVNEIFKIYPDQDVVSLIDKGEIDYNLIHGMGESTFDKVREKVRSNLEYQEAFEELSEGYGLTANMIKNMSKQYGSPTLLVNAVKDNPYVLADDVDGIGFKKADAIALNSGINKESEKRIKACIRFSLKQQADNGHSYVPTSNLRSYVASELGINTNLIDDYMKRSDSKVFTIEDGISFINVNRDYELSIANNIKRLLSTEDNYYISDVEARIEEAEDQQGFQFVDEQVKGIEGSIANNFYVICGNAGSGKSSLLRGVIHVLRERKDLSYATCALSGKASQRIREATGLESSTIHRLLKYNPMEGGFEYNKENQLPHDIIVIDEASMVNTFLFSKLIESIKDGAKLIVLGDDAQFEAIGVGNVLHDLLSSPVPQIKLTKVHRQAEMSGILSSANKVRVGQQIFDPKETKPKRLGELKDLFIYPEDDPEYLLDRVMKIAEQYKDNGGHLDDFQVLGAMKKRGLLSVKNLNDHMQNLFNPDEIGKGKLVKGDTEFREGDKVIQNGNNYDHNVFNGTLGYIAHADSTKKLLIIDFEGGNRVQYEDEKLNQIGLAYALTAHKCVVGDTHVLTEDGIVQISQYQNKQSFPMVYNGERMESPSNFMKVQREETIKIETSRGYKLEGTKDHKVEIISSNGYTEMKMLEDVNEDDHLILQKNTNVFGNKVDIPDYFYDIDLDVRAKKYTLPRKLTPELSLFLGMMVADGTVHEKGFKFSKRYLEVTELFAGIVNELFGYNSSDIRLRKYGDYIIEVGSTQLASFIKKFDGVLPNNKYVPKIILESTKENQVAFLKGVFEDGTVNVKKDKFDHIELSMKSELMCEQIKAMLLNIGIVCTSRNLEGEANIIYIYKDFADIYMKEIGFVSDFKSKRLDKISESVKKLSPKKSTPHIQKILNNMVESIDSKLNENVSNAMYRGKITNGMLKRVLEKYNGKIEDHPSYEYISKFKDEYYAEPIKKIESSENETYSFEMPDTHMFLQNGIRGSNCQGSQFKNTVIALDYSAYVLLSRQFIYTAMTRAETYCFLVCQTKALKHAIRTDNMSKRNTFLKGFLHSMLK